MSSRDDLPTVTLVDRADFPCPYCGMLAAVGTVAKGPEQLVGMEVVEHIEPRCPRFVAADSLEFLRDAEAKIREKIPQA